MDIYGQIASNRRKTYILMFFFAILVLAIGYIFSRAFGFEGFGALSFVGIFLIIAGILNLFSYYWSDKFVIALSGAKPIAKKDAPKLYRIVENLCIGAGIPRPKVYLIEDSAPNAFATGRDPKHAAIAVTRGLYETMKDLELEGVVAHELSHIRNYDTRLMAVVSVLVGLIAILADFFLRSLFWGRLGGRNQRQAGALFVVLGLVAAVLAPISAKLIQLAVSRKREYLADSSAALLTRYPEGLASALEKISNYTQPLKKASTATAHFYISNPLGKKARKDFLMNLFNTHPPAEERIKILRGMK